jgi:hypothetical protein
VSQMTPGDESTGAWESINNVNNFANIRTKFKIVSGYV